MIFRQSMNPAFSHGRSPIFSPVMGDVIAHGGMKPFDPASRRLPPLISNGHSVVMHPVLRKRVAAIMAKPETKAILIERTVNQLRKTHPKFAKAIWDVYRSNPEKWIKSIGNSAIYTGAGMHGLGDWSDLFSEAAKSVVQAGTQYAAASAQQKLNIDAAQKAADIQNKQMQLQAQNAIAQATLSKQQSKTLDALQPKSSVMPWVFGATAAAVAGFVGYKAWKGKKKR